MNRKRLLYAFVGIVVMLFSGFIYAWSILSSFIAADYPDWSNGALTLTFTLCMAFFCLGCLASGLLSKRISARVNVMIASALFLSGFALASRIDSLGGLYLTYGVLCGIASGFAYNSVLNVMPQWFPDNPGLISGILLMGFGSSSLVIGTAFTYFTSTETGAWRSSFLFMGVVISTVIFICSFFFRAPRKEELPEAKKAAEECNNIAERGHDTSVGEMLRCSSFWNFFVWSTLLAGMGLAIIAQAKPIAAMVGTGISPGAISLVVGLISVFNGLGRILIGGMFDRTDRKFTMLTLNIISIACAALLVLAIAIKSFTLIVIGFLGAGIAYGGCPTISAAFIRLFFGKKHYPVNFSAMNLNLLVASLFGTGAGLLYEFSGDYMTTFIALGACALISLMILPRIKKS